MKKWSFPLLSKIALIISGIFFLLIGVIKFLELQEIYIYISGVTTPKIIPNLLVPGAFFLICGTAIYFYVNCKHIVLKILVILLALALAVAAYYYVIFSLFFTPFVTCYEFTSDDQQHTIIICEESWLRGRGCKVYKKTSFCTVAKIDSIREQEIPYPLNPDKLSVVWNEDNFEVHYGEKVIEIEYGE